MNRIPPGDARVLPFDWGGCQHAWQHRSSLAIDANIPPHQEAVTFAMPVSTRPLMYSWIDALVNRPDVALPGDVALWYQPGPTLRALPDSARKQVVHLQLNRESELSDLVDAPVAGVRSIAFRDCDEKAYKPPSIDLSGVQELDIPGRCKSLKRLFATYGWASSLRSLSLPTPINKPGRFLLEPGALPVLEELRLRVWIHPSKLWPYFEHLDGPRHLHINNKLDVALAERCRALPWWKELHTLRIEGADMGPRQAMAFLESPFHNLETLQLETWTTYGGLGKAPKEHAVLSALAAKSKPLPVTTLIVRTTHGEGLRELANSHAFPRLERLYIRTCTLNGLAMHGSPIMPLQTILANPVPTPESTAFIHALRHLDPLVERGVRIYFGG